jgi:poly(3-hydroxybutyrate) depolymerase
MDADVKAVGRAALAKETSMSSTRSIAMLALAYSIAGSAYAATPNLQAYGANPQMTSVSGLSSGGYMAVQLQVAYSKSIIGAGIVAGGPYYCAANAKLTYVSICMGQVPMFPPNASIMANAAKQSALAQRIDPLSNLAARRIYIFSGTGDSVVRPPAVNATATFFELVGVKKVNLNYVHDMPAGHAVIAPGYGNDCSANSAPYISHCTLHGKSYDQAGALLSHIYGELQPRVDAPAGEVVSFNQRAYAAASTGMAGVGYLYVPPACAAGEACKVHVALHGCLQAAGSADGQYGDQFFTKAGYNNWADNNHILVLYPQVEAGRANNPKDCWDWWGYSSTEYAYRSAPQMKAIMAMVSRIGEPR